MTKVQRIERLKDLTELIGAIVGGFLGQFLQPFLHRKPFTLVALHLGPFVMGTILGWSFMQIFEKGGDVIGKRANYKKRLAYSIVSAAFATVLLAEVIKRLTGAAI